MPTQAKLALNEALLVVNKVNLADHPPLRLLYQTHECYGCPLVELSPRAADGGGGGGVFEPGANTTAEQQVGQSFVVSSRFSFQLELRGESQLANASAPNDTTSVAAQNWWCRLPNVALNNQGRYRLDVSPAASGAPRLGDGGGQSLLCALETLDSGECALCPLALLLCVLLAFAGLEQLYARLWAQTRRRKRGPAHYDRASERKLSTPRGVSADAASASLATEPAEAHQKSVAVDGAAAAAAAAPAATAPASGADARANGDPDAGALSAPARRRIECLDTFRGLTLAGMIFVNYGGAGYAVWEHTPWDGITPADFVFPFFVFSMGASVAISVKGQMRRRSKSLGQLVARILRRSTTLGLLGVCLNSKWVPMDEPSGLSKLRLTGVLQRFALSYLVVAIMYTVELALNKWFRAQSLSQVPYLSKLLGIIFELLTAVNFLTLYVYFTFFFEYDPNCPVGYTGPGGQTEGGRYAACTGGAAAWLDRALVGPSHLYNDHEVKQVFMTRVSHDPEGLLGYTTSILLALMGLQCGKILASRKSHKQKLLALAQWSVALTLASSLVLLIPINKRLWSLTFVTVTGLAAFLTISALYALIDVYSVKGSFLQRLVASAGKNSIFLYVAHSLISGMLPWWFPVGDATSRLQLLLRLSWAVFVWLLVARTMELKGIFITV